MGFFNNMFSDPFDYNGDGYLSADVSFAEFMAFDQVMQELEQYDEDDDPDDNEDSLI